MSYTNLLLINKTLSDVNVFINSCNENTFPLVYSESTTYNDLNISNVFQTGIINRIAIVCHNSQLTFVENKEFMSTENTEFIISMIKKFKVKNIDFLACDTLNDTKWTDFYTILFNATGVIIGASNDKTGNIKFGGDWVMESTSENVENVYFSKSIEYYQYLLSITYDFTNINYFTFDKLDLSSLLTSNHTKWVASNSNIVYPTNFTSSLKYNVLGTARFISFSGHGVTYLISPPYTTSSNYVKFSFNFLHYYKSTSTVESYYEYENLGTYGQNTNSFIQVGAIPKSKSLSISHSDPRIYRSTSPNARPFDNRWWATTHNPTRNINTNPGQTLTNYYVNYQVIPNTEYYFYIYADNIMNATASFEMVLDDLSIEDVSANPDSFMSPFPAIIDIRLYLNGNSLYYGSSKNIGYVLYNGILYNGENKNTGYALYNGILYNGENVNIGYYMHQNITSGILYNGGNINNSGYVVFPEINGSLYYNSSLSNGYVVFPVNTGKLYYNGSLLRDLFLHTDDNLYDDGYLKQGYYFHTNGKLYYNGSSKGYVLYPTTGKLYYNGIISSGYIIYSVNNLLYYNGSKEGYLLNPENNELYHNGEPNTGYYQYNNKLYNGSKLATGNVTFPAIVGRLYINGVINNDLYSINNNKLFYKGIQDNYGFIVYPTNGGNLYYNGILKDGYYLYPEIGGSLYYDGILTTGYAIHPTNNELYYNGSPNKGYALFNDKLYYNSNLNIGYAIFPDNNGKLYNGDSLDTVTYVNNINYNFNSMTNDSQLSKININTINMTNNWVYSNKNANDPIICYYSNNFPFFSLSRSSPIYSPPDGNKFLVLYIDDGGTNSYLISPLFNSGYNKYITFNFDYINYKYEPSQYMYDNGIQPEYDVGNNSKINIYIKKKDDISPLPDTPPSPNIRSDDVVSNTSVLTNYSVNFSVEFNTEYYIYIGIYNASYGANIILKNFNIKMSSDEPTIFTSPFNSIIYTSILRLQDNILYNGSNKYIRFLLYTDPSDNKEYLFGNGYKHTGIYNNKYYYNGTILTGLSPFNTLFVDGIISTNYYKHTNNKLYFNGVQTNGYVLYGNVLNTTKLFIDGDIPSGNNIVMNSLYTDGNYVSTTTASTSGDPYINTFEGFKYKLPNIIRTYRLLDFHMTDKDEKLTINASVSPLKEEEKNMIMSIDKFKKHNPVINGFFYNEFYISTNNSYILLDRMFNLIKCSNITDFEIKLQNEPKLFKCDIQGESLYVAKIIYIFGVRIELRLFDNPQILNGIEISVPDIKNTTGLLSSRINPKNFMIKTITDTKKITIKSDKVYNRVVKENWIKVA